MASYVNVAAARRGEIRRFHPMEPATPETTRLRFGQEESTGTGPDAVDASGSPIDWTKIITTATTAVGGAVSSIWGGGEGTTPSAPSTVGAPRPGAPSGLAKPGGLSTGTLLLVGGIAVAAVFVLSKKRR